MKIGKYIIYPWNRKNFIPRLIAIALVLGWFVWGIILYYEGQQIKARKQEFLQKYEMQQMRLRRQAAYERRQLEERGIRQGTQNAIDGIKR